MLSKCPASQICKRLMHIFESFLPRNRSISQNTAQKHIKERELSKIDSHIISILQATNHSAEMGIYGGALSYMIVILIPNVMYPMKEMRIMIWARINQFFQITR